MYIILIQGSTFQMSWDEKARNAYYQRQEEAEQRRANRLAAMLSEMLGETIPPSGNKIKLTGRAGMAFILEHDDSEYPSVVLGCQVCQSQYYQEVTSLADIGDILINGKKPHVNCTKIAPKTKYPAATEKAE